jgi:hypothetical protein
VAVERAHREMHIKASELCHVIRAVCLVGRPSLRGAAVDLHDLALGGNQYVLLRAGSRAIVAELIATVVSFGGI